MFFTSKLLPSVVSAEKRDERTDDGDDYNGNHCYCYDTGLRFHNAMSFKSDYTLALVKAGKCSISPLAVTKLQCPAQAVQIFFLLKRRLSIFFTL